MINGWTEKSKSYAENNKATTQVEKKRTKFYKSTRRLDLVQKVAATNKIVSELPTIMLSSKKNKLTDFKSTEMQQPTRKYTETNMANSARNDQPKKKLKTSGNALVTSSLTNEETLEDDVFKEYLNYDKQWKPVQRKCSLLESLDHVR